MIVYSAIQYIWLGLLVVVPLCALAIFYGYTSVRSARLLSTLPGLLTNFSLTRTIIRTALYVVALLSILVALVQPSWGIEHDVVEQRGRDVYVALDISRSMCAQDVSPDRLTMAQRAILKLIDELDSDRVSLILFANQARVHCPLTGDMQLFRSFVQHIDYAMMGTSRTCLRSPIELVLAKCERDKKSANRVLVLVTDGEDFGGDLEAVKSRARACGLTIVVLGVGTTLGGPIATYNEQGQQTGYLKDRGQQVIISRLNQSALEALARGTGGIAHMITNNEIDVSSLVARIEHIEKVRHGTTPVVARIGRSYLFCACAAVCLLLEWIL